MGQLSFISKFDLLLLQCTLLLYILSVNSLVSVMCTQHFVLVFKTLQLSVFEYRVRPFALKQILEFGFVRLSSPSTPKGQGVVPERVTRFLIQEVDHQLSYRIFIKVPRSLETQDNAGQGKEIAIAYND